MSSPTAAPGDEWTARGARPFMTSALHERSVTVVGIYYAPDSTGIAPYTTDFCRTLADAGASVHAIVGFPHYPRWRLEPAYRRRLVVREVEAHVAVTRVRHSVPRRQNVLTRGLYELSFRVASGMVARTRGRRPDAVIGITPSLAGAITARSFASRVGAPWGVVVQDLVGLAAGQSGVRGGGRVGAAVARVEVDILRSADLVAVITDAFATRLVTAGIDEGRIVRLPNYAHITDTTVPASEARATLGWPADLRVVLHTGNMGLKQDLGNVVAAARAARDCCPDVLFILLGDGSTRRELEERARDLPNLRFVGPVPTADYPLTLAAADCLLVNERATVLDMSLPSKLTSYFSAGRPVVAATHRHGATAAEVTKSRAGLVVEPGRPEALLSEVRMLLDSPALAAQLGHNGRQYAREHLSRDVARQRITEFVEALIFAR